MNARSLPRFNLETLAFVAVGVVLFFFTYVRFFAVPYIGFQYTNSGEVVSLFSQDPQSDPLELGDQLVTVNGYSWSGYPDALRDQPFMGLIDGDAVELTIEREDQVLDLEWVMPGFSLAEFIGRFLGIWVVSFVFWVAGAFTLILIRPRTVQRSLLAAFNFVTAIWVLTGSLSRTHAYDSPFAMRAALWMSAPIYLHFHWVYPRKIKELPAWVWWLLYSFFGVAAVLQWGGGLSARSYIYPFSIAVAGSLLLLLLRFFIRRDRQQVGLIFFAMFMTFSPTLLLALSPSLNMENLALVGTLFALPILPGAYFYTIFRRQLGGLELRANRLISIYFFISLLILVALLLAPLISAGLTDQSLITGALLATVVGAGLVTLLAFPSFQSFVERHILSIPLPPETVLERYSGLLATSLTEEHLIHVLRDQVFPSLFIREAILVASMETGKEQALLSMGLTGQQEQQALALSFDSLPQENSFKGIDGARWVHLALPLRVADRTVGYLLLGRKDPDDYYSQREEDTLQAIASQTAVALVNIEQARRLRALHQADIAREETERRDLAHELHDDILGRIAEVGKQVREESAPAEIEEKLQSLSGALRGTINNLRPPMLNLGLYAALMQLVDDLAVQPNAPEIELETLPAPRPYPSEVEQHLFRIVQQASDNSLKHGQATRLSISGELGPNAIDLVVRDNGVGFDAADGVDLLDLLQDHHFGMAGMYERAELIGAELEIYSRPGQGTEVRLRWKMETAPSEETG